jgi:hypothetical protein
MGGPVSGGGLGFLAVRFLRRIGRFGRSVPVVVVLVVVEQLEGLGGLGEDADGFGAAYVDGVVVALPGRMSALRSMVALNQMASPAVARAMIIFSPCSLDRPSRTNRSCAARAARCSAPTGSASMIVASSRVCSRP